MNIILCIIIFFQFLIILYLLVKNQTRSYSNKADVLKGIELERRKREYKQYLESYYFDTMPPESVKNGYKEIEKEVLGYYL